MINRPVDEVFDFMADARNEPLYNPRMLRAEKLSPGPISLGTRFRDEIKSMGQPAEITIEIVGYERPWRRTDSIHLSTMDIRGGLTLDPRSAGTRMQWSWELMPHGAFKLMTPSRPHRPAPEAEDLGQPQARHGSTSSALLYH